MSCSPFPVACALALSLGLGAASIGCGDIKHAGPTDGGAEAATAPDVGDASTAGPGRHGSLPSGYCCTADTECRDRHCAAVGSGGRMCLDACRSERLCVRPDIHFKCSATTPAEDGFCVPPDPSFVCLPQANFRRGTRQSGDCCAATGDGTAGSECDGNQCISEGDESNPYVCSNHCNTSEDCPPTMTCGSYDVCAPANRPYTCH